MRPRSHSRAARRHSSILALAACAVLLIAPGAGLGPPLGTRAESGTPLAFREGSLSQPAARRASLAWQGGKTATSTGAQLTLYVSDAYGSDQVQRWADFFASLPHGEELARLTAYVAPLSEVAWLCGPGALGCYWSNELVTVGDPVGPVPAEEVARHEYGHHVAWNRSNAPWLAVDWGTKRWASHANICARAKAGTVFPGDEDAHYRQNPGEAFAEAYRAMVEVRSGASGFAWSLVDASFYPDAASLRAVEDDVLRPWTSGTRSTLRARFRPSSARTWTRTVTTPLDGIFDLRLTMPAGALYDATVLSADGKTVIAKTLWSGTSTKSATFQVCGERSMLVRVTRRGAAGRFQLDLTRP